MDLLTIIDHYQSRFIAGYSNRLTYHHINALHAVQACQTERYGKMVLRCSPCDNQQTRFHSCGHRSCPRCQNHDTSRWLERQSQKLLPVEYFMVTFTLPYELRALTWHHQSVMYSILFECAISTLKDFGVNDRKLGADLGMTAVLHTHSRRLDYHPHVHIIVPGGCLNQKRRQWKKLRGNYLFNEFALAKVFRARLLASVYNAGLSLPDKIPQKWVVDCRHVGKGLPALKYLSRYLYRGVISEKNIMSDDGTHVTFRYRDSKTETWKTRRVKGEQFLWFVFQHVLPKGFRRVRDFGFLHGNAKKSLRLIQLILKVVLAWPEPRTRPTFKCASCGGPMTIIGFIPPVWRAG
ncbi:MAG: IS91 family transposase [Gammaproteobacteria bacterium]|nr:MAG: IS91 family transposase [Gammaproteobacteria bacterium]